MNEVIVLGIFIAIAAIVFGITNAECQRISREDVTEDENDIN